MEEEYVIINKTAMLKRIEELEKMNSEQGWGAKIAFKEILSQSTPLVPEIEKSFDAGVKTGDMNIQPDFVKNIYISNLKLDIK